MLAGPPSRAESLLLTGFWVALAVWVGTSAIVLLGRLIHDYNVRAMRLAAAALADPSLLRLPASERLPKVKHILKYRSRRVVYRLIADASLLPIVAETCADYAVDRWGLPRMTRDAKSTNPRRKWRRISALFALGQIRADGIHELLEIAVHDPDHDAHAAVVALNRLQDKRAALILVDALRARAYSASRIATQLDLFVLPIDDLLRPGLDDRRAHARYWSASLLAKYADLSGMVGTVMRLATDESAQVRKAAIEALAGVKPSTAIPIAVIGMGDPVGYVRSRAIRTLARLGAHARRSPVRHEIARHIVAMLSDDEWEVRNAAKESLTAMGPEIWREVASGLDAEDRFARNSAAEVLQNLGLLDRLIDDVGRGVEPSAELMSVLERAFREGGPGLVDAALARSNPDLFASVEQLLKRLQVVGVKVA